MDEARQRFPYSVAYYAEYAQAIQTHWWFRGREQVVASLVASLVGPAAGAVVADVGCGPGGPARAAFPAGYLIGTDMHLEPLRAYAALSGRVVGDAARLPYRPRSLSAVCAFDVLEHLADDAAALREWRAALATGGWLVLTVPAYRALWSHHDQANGHQRRYRRSALRRLLERSGFRVARATYFNTLLLPGIAAMRWAQRWLPTWRGTTAASEELDFRHRLPGWIERGCEGALRLEARWLRRHGLPAGVSIGVVAQAATTGAGAVPV